MPLLLESLSLMKERVVSKFCKEGYKFSRKTSKKSMQYWGKGGYCILQPLSTTVKWTCSAKIFPFLFSWIVSYSSFHYFVKLKSSPVLILQFVL